MTTNTSWALVPRRATSLKPPVIGVEIRSRRLVLRPRTRLITAGVTVSMPLSWASCLSKGIKPSM